MGQPPFYTTSIYTLIHNIVKDPVKFPADMSPDFKSFLQARLPFPDDNEAGCRGIGVVIPAVCTPKFNAFA